MPDESTSLVGSQEAEGILGISRSTLVRWAASGKLRVAQRLPGATGVLLFDRAEVEALRQTQETEASAVGA